MEKDAIEVGVDTDSLTIRGNKAGEDNPSSMSNYCMERVFGNFSRTIPLPKGMDTLHASAVYRNGILTVTIPRSKGHKATKRIKISNRA
jgi:HSP20 family protein